MARSIFVTLSAKELLVLGPSFSPVTPNLERSRESFCYIFLKALNRVIILLYDVVVSHYGHGRFEGMT